jgi:hypothetical protein
VRLSNGLVSWLDLDAKSQREKGLVPNSKRNGKKRKKVLTYIGGVKQARISKV